MAVLTVLFAFGYEETKFVRPAGYEGDSVESLESGTVDKKTASERSAAQASFPHYLRLQILTPTSESLWKAFYLPFFTVAIPQVLFTSLVYGFSLCVISIMASMKAIILTAPPYNFNPQELGLMYIGPFIGTVFGALYGGILVDRGVVWLARRNRDTFEPEMRLYFLPIAALAMAAGTIMFGVTADRGLHWAYPATGIGIASFGFGGIANIVFTLMIDSYPKIVGQTFVAISFFRNAISVIGAFAVNPWRQSMSVTAMFVLAASLSLSACCLAMPLAMWGKKIRAANSSRYHHLSQSRY